MTTAELQTKQAIRAALLDFQNGKLLDRALKLFGALGYTSDMRVDLDSPTAAGFLDQFDGEQRMDRERALTGRWRRVELVFQLTEGDVRNGGQQNMFASPAFDLGAYNSFLFFALELEAGEYTRTQLANITREINKLFTMPVSVLFRCGPLLTLAIVTHRPNKVDSQRDVLEKVTLIKDVDTREPHRAHVEILFDLTLGELHARHSIRSFDDLQQAWKQTLDSSELNKRFFKELANWYFWAVERVEFPADAEQRREVRNATSVIRLITRVMFVWFLKEKGLAPDELFDQRKLKELLVSLDPQESTFYKAILQNLFFATLNTEMNDPKTPRRFRGRNVSGGRDSHHLIPNVYRYESLFRDPQAALELFKDIPFLNGGLFEMLDKRLDDDTVMRVDGFSDHPKNPLRVPNSLFFAPEQVADLNAAYGTNNKTYKVRGLIDILQRYKFTIAENTPIEEEIALDPELLGQVFENLLAAYNPETKTTARKQTGSFYTPREIVNYMVDESLVAYFEQHLTQAAPLIPGFDAAARETLPERLRYLLAYSGEPHRFGEEETRHLIVAIDTLKILDPAAGSGAFPMGILHKLVYILGKLDPRNERWRMRQIARANDIQDADAREGAVETIEEAFERNELDYGRKLFLIENCIYGVDIQPVAVQIAKLRCFIALIVDQKIDHARPNRGIRPLPNLETKFVAANTLIGIPRPQQMTLRDPEIEAKEKELARVRSAHFSARTPATKRKYREQDKAIRAELATLLRRDGFSGDTAKLLAAWDPYDQNASAPFFDAEWMFGIDDGFDITIGNPPYVRADAMDQAFRRKIEATKQYETLWEKWDLYIPFIELGYKLLAPGGVTSMIVSDAFCHSKYAQKPQKWYLANSKVLRLDFFSKIRIFEAAVHNITYLFQRADGRNNSPQRRVHDPEFGCVTLLPCGPQNQLTHRAFFPEDTDQSNFKAQTTLLKDICYISKGMAVHAHEESAPNEFELDDLVSLTRDSKHPKAFVEGKHLARWIASTNRWLEWGTRRAPALFSRPTFPQMYEVPEKLISVDMSAGVSQLRVAYDNQQLYHNHSAWSFIPWHSLKSVQNNSLKKAARYRDEPVRTDLPKREALEKTSQRFSVKYLLGVMNSTAARDFLRANRRSNIHLYPDDWKKLPIPDVSKEQQQPVVALVTQILAAKQRDPAADVVALEAEIDAHVYRLYGLTEEEIMVVEESVKR